MSARAARRGRPGLPVAALVVSLLAVASAQIYVPTQDIPLKLHTAYTGEVGPNSYAIFTFNLTTTSGVIVEMRREGGDPVLFLKPERPTDPRSDLRKYSDEKSAIWYSRLHYIQRSSLDAGLYYVAIFNDGGLLSAGSFFKNETCAYNLTVRAGATVPCVSTCTGSCTSAGACACPADRAGESCEYPVAALKPGSPLDGVVEPGAWFYFGIAVPADFRYRLILEVRKAGGDLSLFAQPEAAPTIHSNRYEPLPITDPETMVLVDYSRLPAGTLYFGFFNFDYRVVSPARFLLQVSFTGEPTSLTMVTVTVTVSAIFLMACVLTCCRMLWRRRLYASLDGNPPRTLAEFISGTGGQRAREAAERAQRARDAALVAALPVFRWGEAGEGAAPAPEPECIICLAEFAAGEELRRLPCGHAYHLACIDRWLHHSMFCPLCKQPVDRSQSAPPTPAPPPADGPSPAPSSPDSAAALLPPAGPPPAPPGNPPALAIDMDAILLRPGESPAPPPAGPPPRDGAV